MSPTRPATRFARSGADFGLAGVCEAAKSLRPGIAERRHAAGGRLGGPVYLATALVLNGLFLKGAIDIWKRDEVQAEADGYRVEKSFFKLSLLYLFLHFGAIAAEALLAPYGLGGWA